MHAADKKTWIADFFFSEDLNFNSEGRLDIDLRVPGGRVEGSNKKKAAHSEGALTDNPDTRKMC